MKPTGDVQPVVWKTTPDGDGGLSLLRHFLLTLLLPPPPPSE